VSAERDALYECAGLSGDQLARVLQLLSNSDITELDVTLGGTRLSLRRPATAANAEAVGDGHAMAEPEPTTLAIASPLVGIFRPAVNVGDAIAQGESIGAIEALGMPTSVDAPHSGTVEDLLVPPGTPVEYGQPLLTLRRGSSSTP
jgi:biotin carboxyl carrier protein